MAAERNQRRRSVCPASLTVECMHVQAPAGAPGSTMKATLRTTVPKAVGHDAPPAGSAAQDPQQEAAPAASQPRRAASPPHSVAATTTAAGSSDHAAASSSSASPAPQAAQEGDLAADGCRPGAEQAVAVLPSAATGIAAQEPVAAGGPASTTHRRFEEHEATRGYSAAAMVGKVRLHACSCVTMTQCTTY